MCVHASYFSGVQLFTTLWTVAHQAPLSIGFSRQEYWSGLPCPSPGDLPNQGLNWVFYISCIGRWVLLPLAPPGKLINSVAQSCPTLCNPIDYSTPGFPVLHQLLELAQTHVHWVGDAIQQSHPLSSPSPPAFNLSQHQGLFQWVSGGQSIGISASASVFPINIQDRFILRLVGSCSPRDSQESSPTPHFKSINSSALSFLYNPTLTSIHDYWKNHSFD